MEERYGHHPWPKTDKTLGLGGTGVDDANEREEGIHAPCLEWRVLAESDRPRWISGVERVEEGV